MDPSQHFVVLRAFHTHSGIAAWPGCSQILGMIAFFQCLPPPLWCRLYELDVGRVVVTNVVLVCLLIGLVLNLMLDRYRKFAIAKHFSRVRSCCILGSL